MMKRILCASSLFISSFQFILGKKPKVPGNILQVTQHGGFSSENPPSAVHVPTTTTMERSATNSPTSVECSVVSPPSASPTSIEVNTSLSDSASVHSACSPLPVHADVSGCTVGLYCPDYMYYGRDEDAMDECSVASSSSSSSSSTSNSTKISDSGKHQV